MSGERPGAPGAPSGTTLTPRDLANLSPDTYPALGRGVWGVLARNEWFKLRRRPAFYVTLGFFAFVHLMDDGGSFFRARSDADYDFALPRAWSQVFSGDAVLVLFFGCIALIMLASSEFSWRTARQNVIDGLSKTQWFWGKVMLLPYLGAIFVVVRVASGGMFALLSGGLPAEGSAVPLSVLAASGGLLLAFFSVASLALLLCLGIRASGPAMAVWFFWIALGEQLVPQLLGRAFPGLQAALGYLPFNAAQKLLEFPSYDAGAYARIVAAAEAAGETAPQLPDLTLALGVNAGWTIVFLSLAYVLYDRRDL